jgi:hypothetical protein
MARTPLVQLIRIQHRPTHDQCPNVGQSCPDIETGDCSSARLPGLDA